MKTLGVFTSNARGTRTRDLSIPIVRPSHWLANACAPSTEPTTILLNRGMVVGGSWK